MSLLTLIAAGCADKAAGDTGDTGVGGTGSIPDEVIHDWGYDDVYDEEGKLIEAGPDSWELVVVYDEDGNIVENQCGGTSQSPVDIPSSALAGPLDKAEVLVSYGVTSLRAVNNGHTIQYNVDETAGGISMDGVAYDLLQFHFHSYSEHTLDGEHSDLEMHFVHQSADGELAVIGVFLNGADTITHPNLFVSPEAAESEDDGALMFHDALALPVVHSPSSEDFTELGGSIDLGQWFDFLGDVDLIHYSGSLTTPPCTEGVRWFISSAALSLRTEDVEAFRAVYDHNYRPLQELNGRDFTVVPGTE